MDDGAWRFAVLGPGGIGGLLAGVLARQGHEVVCLAGDATAAHLAEHGLRVRSTVFGDFEVGVRAATRLDEPVDACIVAVKAYQLEDALERVEPEALGEGLVVPFLNGVEHVQVLRGRYPAAQVVPASIAVEAFKAGPAAERAGEPAQRRPREAAGGAERAGERSEAVHGRPPEPGDEPDLRVDTGGPDGVLRYRRVGRLATPWGELTLFWLVAYGGGLFLPFRDQTAGRASYGGGRYLTDTVKGTFGRGLVALDDGQVALDFNYAYNPSCAYDPGWACPLAPPENHLAGAVEAGERYEAGGPVVT